MKIFQFPIEYYAYSSLFNCLACVAIIVVVLCKQPKSATARLFSCFTSLIAIWAWFYFLWLRTIDNPSRADFFERTCMIPVVLMPPVFLQVVFSLTGQSQRTIVSAVNYLLSFLLVLTIYTPLFSPGVSPHLVFPYWLIPGPVFPLHLLQIFSSVGYGLWLLVSTARNSTGHRRRQLFWVFWAYATGFLSGFTNYLAWYRFPLPPVLNPFVWLHVAAIAYAIVKHQLMDIRIVIRRGVVYSILIACITASYLVMVLIMEKWFQGFLGYRSVVATGIVAFVIAVCFNPLRNWIQARVDRALFKGTPVELAAQREQLLHEVQKSEQLKAVATLAAGMAHEIKNPLAAIKTFTEFLPEKHRDPEFIKTFHRIVGQEVERIHTTVQNLLTFAKPEAMTREPVNIAVVIHETLALLNGDCLKRRVAVETSIEEPSLQMIGDRTRLRQALLNLCLNSLEAMEGGGTLSVAVSSQNAHITLAVRDTGKGIARADLPRVFEPFFTTKPTGTGLGLSVVHGIVEEHGGTVSIDSQSGQGTIVRLELPAAGNQTTTGLFRTHGSG